MRLIYTRKSLGFVALSFALGWFCVGESAATPILPTDEGFVVVNNIGAPTIVGHSAVFANLNYQKDSRGMFEFSLASIPAGSVVTSAVLMAYVDHTGGLLSGILGTFQLHGYSGDGVITAADFNNDKHLLQTFTNWSNSSGFGWKSYGVTSFVQSGVASGDLFAGFLFKATSNDVLIGFNNSVANQTNRPATLDVQFVAPAAVPNPEPSSVFSFVSAIVILLCSRVVRSRWRGVFVGG